MVMDGRGHVTSKSGCSRDRAGEGHADREEWRVARDNTVNRHRQNINVDRTMAHSKVDSSQMKTMTIGRYPRQAISPSNLAQNASRNNAGVARGDGRPAIAQGTSQRRINDHTQPTARGDYYSTSATLPRPMATRTDSQQVHVELCEHVPHQSLCYCFALGF